MAAGRHLGRAWEDRPGPRGYYLSPAEKGGEPPGRWYGAGLVDLGFRDGQVIDRDVFERLYGKFLDPRDPSGQTRLGRAPQRFRSAEDIYTALLALEPEATAGRRVELMAQRSRRSGPRMQYLDAAFSVSKSITLLHASAIRNAGRAGAEGDLEAVAYWEQAADDVWRASRRGTGRRWSTCSVRLAKPGRVITAARSAAVVGVRGRLGPPH